METWDVCEFCGGQIYIDEHGYRYCDTCDFDERQTEIGGAE